MKTQTTEIVTPRAGSKQAKLIGMLFRKSGVTVTKVSEALGWQQHTTRTTFTGLKNEGTSLSGKT